MDTNVLLDLLGADRRWIGWSRAMLEAAAMRGPLAINDIIFAEVSIGFERIEACRAFLDGLGVEHLPMPEGALFLAGKAFTAYRRRGGSRTGVLPDFFIGAHAVHDDLLLITRDPRRYRTDFPTARLVAPDRAG